MVHQGLPFAWTVIVLLSMVVMISWVLVSAPSGALTRDAISFSRIPLVGIIFRYLVSQTYILLALKVIFVFLFLLIIVAGLWGTPIPERNLSTVLTWNLWWTGVIISILFFGSSWCAVCPWDTIANWLVRHSLWRRADKPVRLNLKVPAAFRSLWPALILLTILTWLELGVGVTDSPYATASLALMMVVLATVSLVLYEDKAFCRYFCPVGRTIGVYSQLSPIALRPVETEICDTCTTLECFHGNEEIDPCPTRLVMGRLQESTYCISCGNCTQSCPSNNINWQLRSPSIEAVQDARPHLDEACFMIGLLGLTSFHGLTMLPVWQDLISRLARMIGDSGQLITTFSLVLFAYLLFTVTLYLIFVYAFRLSSTTLQIRQVFSGFAFVSLPLAFSYHVAHNLNHLLRESGDLLSILLNPLGTNTLPLSAMERHERSMQMMVSADLIAMLQGILLIVGFWLSMQVVKHRGLQIFDSAQTRLLPMIGFAALITIVNLWLLSQPMVMRM